MKLMLLTSVNPLRDQLFMLLNDCVDSGASVGFISPLELGEAEKYWQDVAADLLLGNRLLLVALKGEDVAGAVQLALCTKRNGLHRADVEKLMVYSHYRQQGLGKMLMDEIELLAKQRQRTLLVLDTSDKNAASALYRKCGFIEAGSIPRFALSSGGELESTSYFYKLI